MFVACVLFCFHNCARVVGFGLFVVNFCLMFVEGLKRGIVAVLCLFSHNRLLFVYAGLVVSGFPCCRAFSVKTMFCVLLSAVCLFVGFVTDCYLHCLRCVNCL